MAEVRVVSVPGLPEIAPGDDLAALIARQAEASLAAGAVVCVAQKLVSKAERRVRRLAEVDPSPQALALAAGGAGGGDARLVQVVLDESTEIVRAERGILITRTRHGFVCANAGVDRSNTGATWRAGPVPASAHDTGGPEPTGRGDADTDLAVLLPEDPDRSARELRARLHALTGLTPLAVIVSDSFGRAWRRGQVDVAIGAAGLDPAIDLSGTSDRDGRPLVASIPALADELAAAAGLARVKGAADGVVVLTGLERHVQTAAGPGAAALVRPAAEDLFR